MHRTAHERRPLHDLAFLIGGIGIGSAIALLLAPCSGEDLRYVIGHGYRRTVKKIGRRKEELRDRAEDFLDHALHASNRGARLLRIGREGLRRMG